MPSNYPGTLDVLTNPTPTDPLASATVPHSTQHTNINDIIEAIQAKLGIGTSAPVAGSVFGDNGAGGSLWRQVANADVASAAAIAYSKLALAGTIVNADVATAAAIALSKLAPGSSGVLKSNGTAISAGNLVGTTDLAAHAATDFRYLTWTNATAFGAGAWTYSGGQATVSGLIIGSSFVISIVSVAFQANTLNAIAFVGTGVDATTATLGNTSAVCPLANNVFQMTFAAGFLAAATSHVINPVTFVTTGTHNVYGSQHHTVIVLHR